MTEIECLQRIASLNTGILIMTTITTAMVCFATIDRLLSSAGLAGILPTLKKQLDLLERADRRATGRKKS